MQLTPEVRQKIQDEIEQWADDMMFGRPTQMDAPGVAQAIRTLKHDRETREEPRSRSAAESSERDSSRPLARWSASMLRDELRAIADALKADNGEHYDSLIRQERMVRNEITARDLAQSAF